ncbi:putative pyrophosphatase/phosphodiesterase [Podosphaera aphanis]|nr:putative pyrophosphatase/phosphodiesterase [Podosphaera aphanis]
MELPQRSATTPTLLSPRQYEDDASSIHSERSDLDTDSEDDKVLQTVRTSADIRAYDRSVLLEEEETHQLLTQEKRRMRSHKKALGFVQRPLQQLLSPSFTSLPQLRTDRNKQWRKHQGRDEGKMESSRVKVEEDGSLMFEMEEGVLKTEILTPSSSDNEENIESDRQGLLGLHEVRNQRNRWRTWSLKYFLIAAGLSLLVVLVWKISLDQKTKSHQNLLSNGTALFAPTTILISLDGFRADFLQRGITPRLNTLVKEGVSPHYMRPSFPSVTLPNHYTMVTGLHPESHGIVSNNFWDEKLKEEFSFTHPSAMETKWWHGEPIWVTAEKQGVKTAVHMWPGSEAHIMGIDPSYLDRYNGKLPLQDKAKRVLELLDKPGKENGAAEDRRPQFIAAYVPNVDVDGHKYGPNSTEIRTTIAEVDHMLDNIFVGLEQRNLTNIVNVVIVSDHGMATTDISRMIQLEDLIDINKIQQIDGWPLYGLHPKGDLIELYKALSESTSSNENYDVYLRDKNMPKRYHFSNNHRIAPLWIIPKTGWAIVTKKDFDIEDSKAKGLQYHPRGLHGYDNEHPLMRAIFIARGPAFPQAPHTRLEPFQNIEVYNIICDSLKLAPRPNNGTIRLHSLPISLDQFDTTPEIPQDPEDRISPTATHESIHLTPMPTLETSTILSPTQPTVSEITEIPETSAESDVDLKWITDKQKELWGWFKGSTVRLKNWWDQLVSESK